MQTLGLLKELAVRGVHEDPLDARLADLLVPLWASQILHRINAFKRWRWNEETATLTWPTSGILYLPEWVDYPLSLRFPQVATSQGRVEVVDATKFDADFPESSLDGIVRLVVYGHYGVEADMPAAGQVTVTSSAGVVDQGMSLVIDGKIGARVETETVTLGAAGTATTVQTFDAGEGGVRRVAIIAQPTALLALPTTVPWRQFGSGRIVVTSGGTTLESFDSVYERGHYHRRTELYGGSGAYVCRYSRRHRPLVRDLDIIEIPQEFEEIMELGLREKLLIFKKQLDEAAAVHGMISAQMQELIGWDERQPARTRVPSIKEW